VDSGAQGDATLTDASDAMRDGDANTQQDDPCPSGMVVNCSMTCGNTSDVCAQAACGADVVGGVLIQHYNQLPLTIRTPHVTQANPTCPSCAGAGETRIANGFAIYLAFVDPGIGPGVVIHAPPPWQIAYHGNGVPHCADNSPAPTNCLAVGDAQLLLFSNDLNAPSRNVVIEEAPESGTACP
jgi:hypothetical protein